MRLFDTHAHLDDARYAEDLPDVLDRMRASGVARCVTVGSDKENFLAAQAIAQSTPGVFFAAGVHPHEASKWKPSDLALLQTLLKAPKSVAWGEIGLDYHYEFSPRSDQRSVFDIQLQAAYSMGLPAILHVRQAHEEALDMLTAMRQTLPTCIVHCYSGDWHEAMRYMDLGCMISFAGTVTFKNATDLLEVACKVPMDRMLIETDSPYLAPVPHRGKRNEPAWVANVAQHIAAQRGVDCEALCEQTYQNACAVYRLHSQEERLAAK